MQYFSVKRGPMLLELEPKGKIDATLSGFETAKSELLKFLQDENFEGIKVVILKHWDKILHPNASVLGAVAPLLGYCKNHEIEIFLDFKNPKMGSELLQISEICNLRIPLSNLTPQSFPTPPLRLIIPNPS